MYMAKSNNFEYSRKQQFAPMLAHILLLCPGLTSISFSRFACVMTSSMNGLGGCRNENDCIPFYTPMYNAMKTYNLTSSDSKVAAFVATVYHETDILRTFYQPLDGGAGAIHMIPNNLRLACSRVPSFTSAIVNYITGPCLDSNLCQCAADSQLSTAVEESMEITFDTAGWFFPNGAALIYGSDVCLALDVAADFGLGAAADNIPSYVSFPTTHIRLKIISLAAMQHCQWFLPSLMLCIWRTQHQHWDDPTSQLLQCCQECSQQLQGLH